MMAYLKQKVMKRCSEIFALSKFIAKIVEGGPRYPPKSLYLFISVLFNQGGPFSIEYSLLVLKSEKIYFFPIFCYFSTIFYQPCLFFLYFP